MLIYIVNILFHIYFILYIKYLKVGVMYMNIVVQKYGGTSVESKDKLQNICKRIIKYKEAKKDMVIVVSAQGKTTDMLLSKAEEYAKIQDLKSLDILLSTGEMQTVALLCMMLEELGYDTVGLTGTMTGIITDNNFGNAKIENVYSEHILNHLKNGKIVVVSGFQGMDRLGNLTTLGRGGSDLSAVAIASSLKAKICEIYTDVNGVLSCDPKIISKAKLQKNITYNEMLEAASSGAKVLHNRCVSFAKRNNLKLHVKNSQTIDKGSIVSDNKSPLSEKPCIKIISKKENLTKISIISDMISECKNIFSKSFEIAENLDTKIHMISFNELSLNILVDSNKADEYIKELHKALIKKSST